MASWEALGSQLISWRNMESEKRQTFFRGSQTMRNMDNKYHVGKTWVRTNGPSQDHSQWEVRISIYQGAVEVPPQVEKTVPSLAIICFLSSRQQTQGFHTLLRERFASISMLLWHSLSALFLYESVVCPCTQLSWSGYRMTQESAVFQNDNLPQLVNWMWQCCSLGLVMMELLNELFNEQHHHI